MSGYYRSTTGWTKVHGIPWYAGKTDTIRIQVDLEYWWDEDRGVDERDTWLVGYREWNLDTNEVVHTDIDNIRIRSSIALGLPSFCSRTLKGEAYWAQENAEWQPVNQRVAEELWRFCRSFEQ